MSLYNVYRPKLFSEVIGQEGNVKTIKYQLTNKTFSNNYLMTGQRGTGKTSVAKILARALECENPIDGEPCNECKSCKLALGNIHPDIYEIDGASNNKVEDVRNIIDDVKYPPQQSKFKIYIIDEVHMLSNSAFNALLKITEEPPSHVIFIFATTELHKVPATIKSRFQIFTFRNIPSALISEQLKFIAQKEGMNLMDEAADVIAENSEGAMRDAISTLATFVNHEVVDAEIVNSKLGLVNSRNLSIFIGILLSKDVEACLNVYHATLEHGYSTDALIEGIIKLLAKYISQGVSIKSNALLMKALLEYKREAAGASNTEILFNLFIVDFCTLRNETNNEQVNLLEGRVRKIEKFLKQPASFESSMNASKEASNKFEETREVTPLEEKPKEKEEVRKPDNANKSSNKSETNKGRSAELAMAESILERMMNIEF